MNIILKYFDLRDLSEIHREILAGCVTFFTMSYIIFLQPAVLSGSMFNTSTGMNAASIAAATIFASFLASVLMGLFARLPVALAPGMGENFFFVLTVIPAAAAVNPEKGWQIALGTVFVSGVLFFILSAFGGRRWILEAVSSGQRHAIASGIGLFIALIGLRNGSVISLSQTGLSLNPEIYGPDAFLFFVGLFFAAALHARKIPGSLLLGIIITTVSAVSLKFALPHFIDTVHTGVIHKSDLFSKFQMPSSVFSMPGLDFSTFFALDISGALTVQMFPYIFIFLFMMSFDATGTLIAVGERAGLMKDGKLPGMKQAFLCDAGGTILGALFGTSTVTAYIESTAGVEQGGRSGITAITAGLLFLLALFVEPIVQLIGGYAPLTAPVLVIVGSMMMQSIREIDWSDITEGIPAFLVITGIPFTYSISDGIALGLLSYPVIKILSGKSKELNAPMVAAGLITFGYLFFLRPAI